jgi:hypothetical protein
MLEGGHGVRVQIGVVLALGQLGIALEAACLRRDDQASRLAIGQPAPAGDGLHIRRMRQALAAAAPGAGRCREIAVSSQMAS